MSLQRKESSVEDMLVSVRRTLRARMARPNQPSYVEGPLFTFLIGAGFSLSAGVPSTNHLTCALELFSEWLNRLDRGEQLDEQADPPERLDWEHILEITTNRDPSGKASYYELMDQVLPLPPARHDFITAAIQWAANRHLQMTEESILLAALLVAGARGFSGAIRATQDSPLASSFARHIFTTNFDELMPLTFYIGNRPADVVDTVSYRMLEDTPEFPTIVYLHGRHLHYDLKNTPEELKYRFFGEEWRNLDLFNQFRRVLRRTGLIVIGYSGAEDRVMEAIEDALADPQSLPYGLWWSGYRDRTSLSPRAQQLVESSPRAAYLLPEQGGRLPALKLMEELCAGIGLDALEARIDWVDRAQRISAATEPLLGQVLESVRSFLRESRATYFNNYSVSALEKVLEVWHRRIRGFLERVGEIQPQLTSEVLNQVALFMRHTRNYEEALQTAEWSLRVAKANNFDEEIGEAHWHIAMVRLHEQNEAEAEEHLKLALEHNTRAGYAVGAANAHFSLGDIALRSGRVDEALKHYEAALERQTSVSNVLGMANGHESIGDILLHKRQLPEARSSYERALELHRQASSSLGEANDLQGLSAVALLSGDFEAGANFYQQALTLMERIAPADSVADVHMNYGVHLLLAGQSLNAVKALERAQELDPNVRTGLNLVYARWLNGERRIMALYTQLILQFGMPEEADQKLLSELVEAGRVTSEDAEMLSRELLAAQLATRKMPV